MGRSHPHASASASVLRSQPLTLSAGNASVASVTIHLETPMTTGLQFPLSMYNLSVLSTVLSALWSPTAST